MAFDRISIKKSPPIRSGYPELEYCGEGRQFRAVSVPLQWVLLFAFDVTGYQIRNAPPWVSDLSSAFDIVAETTPLHTEAECRSMVRTLLMDRFGLNYHWHREFMDVYFLRIAREGHRLIPNGQVVLNGAIQRQPRGGEMRPAPWTMSRLGRLLWGGLNRPVIDRTGLEGLYGFNLTYSTREGDHRPPIDVALEQQLGLKVEAGRAEVGEVVIDSIRRPSSEP